MQLGTPSHLATSWCNALPFDLASSSDLLSIFKVRLKTFSVPVILDFILCVVFDVQIHVKVASLSQSFLFQSFAASR